MFIGEHHQKHEKEQFEYLESIVSTLYMWKRFLTNSQILDLYYYVSQMMTARDPTFSRNRVHQYVPKSLKSCFKNPSYDASEMKDMLRKLEAGCD